jgi:hypothetical protein
MNPRIVARVASALSAPEVEEPAQAPGEPAKPLPTWKKMERELKAKLRPRIVAGFRRTKRGPW